MVGIALEALSKSLRGEAKVEKKEEKEKKETRKERNIHCFLSILSATSCVRRRRCRRLNPLCRLQPFFVFPCLCSKTKKTPQGPQYVVTNFNIFVCTVCSGVQ